MQSQVQQKQVSASARETEMNFRLQNTFSLGSTGHASTDRDWSLMPLCPASLSFPHFVANGAVTALTQNRFGEASQ